MGRLLHKRYEAIFAKQLILEKKYDTEFNQQKLLYIVRKSYVI